MSMTVSKRVNLTIPDSIYLDLEDWAQQQGRPLANLASFLCETAILEAKESGKYVPSPERGGQVPGSLPKTND